MKDEIKEILDNLKYCKEHDEENNYYPEDIFSKDEPYKLLDYITNLQEELEEEKRIEQEDLKTIQNLEEENEKLKKNQRFHKNGVFSLEYDKETLCDMIEELQQENERLRSMLLESVETTNKAIQIINKDLLNGGDEE